MLRELEQTERRKVLAEVPLYYFDTRDGDIFIRDHTGLNLPNLSLAQIEAARSLADLADDVLPNSMRRTVIVEVRDEHQRVLEARLTFETIIFEC